MIRSLPAILFSILLLSCGSRSKKEEGPSDTDLDSSSSTSKASVSSETQPGVFTIAFGSCNRTELPNPFWDDVRELHPDLWIWGGDNIYADTDDPERLRKMYEAQIQLPAYAALVSEVPVIGTWDDHDYGINDGGLEFKAKAMSQQAFLNFMGVPSDSPRRQREGIYNSHSYTFGGYSVKVLVLDTRYFRSPLLPDPSGEKRYIPHPEPGGTILGEVQWGWLEEELRDSRADFNILVSSIQLLSAEHGFETWGLFPAETQKLLDLIADSGVSNAIILSGDRHISEFSRLETEALDFPLIDFTSSGMTHAYRSFSGEPNPYRVGEVVAVESYGLLLLNGTEDRVTFQIRGPEEAVLAELTQDY